MVKLIDELFQGWDTPRFEPLKLRGQSIPVTISNDFLPPLPVKLQGDTDPGIFGSIEMFCLSLIKIVAWSGFCCPTIKRVENKIKTRGLKFATRRDWGNFFSYFLPPSIE